MTSSEIFNKFEKIREGFKSKVFEIKGFGNALFKEFSIREATEALSIRAKYSNDIFKSSACIVAIVLKNALDTETGLSVFNKTLNEMLDYVDEMPRDLIFGPNATLTDDCLEIFAFLSGSEDAGKNADDFVDAEKKS